MTRLKVTTLSTGCWRAISGFPLLQPTVVIAAPAHWHVDNSSVCLLTFVSAENHSMIWKIQVDSIYFFFVIFQSRDSERRLYASMLSICSFVCLSVCRQNPYPKMAVSQKLNKRRSAILKSPYLNEKISRLWLIWVLSCTFGTRRHPDNQIWTFYKFEMADGRHLKNRILAITQQPIARF